MALDLSFDDDVEEDIGQKLAEDTLTSRTHEAAAERVNALDARMASYQAALRQIDPDDVSARADREVIMDKIAGVAQEMTLTGSVTYAGKSDKNVVTAVAELERTVEDSRMTLAAAKDKYGEDQNPDGSFRSANVRQAVADHDAVIQAWADAETELDLRRGRQALEAGVLAKAQAVAAGQIAEKRQAWIESTNAALAVSRSPDAHAQSVAAQNAKFLPPSADPDFELLVQRAMGKARTDLMAKHRATLRDQIGKR